VKERWWLRESEPEALGELVRLSVAGWMQVAASGTTLSTDRDSAAVRLQGPTEVLLVKWRAVRADQRWRWWLRHSRERNEAHGLLAARACGIRVPPVLAVGERRDRLGRLVGSVLVREFLDGFEAGDVALRGPGGEEVLAALAQGLHTWHAAGYRHGDCWPKNLLVGNVNRRDVLPIGAPQAVRVPPGASLDRLRLRDLARFEAGVRLHLPGYAPFHMLDTYLRGTALPARPVVEPLLVPLVERVLAKRAEDERTRPVREPSGPPRPVPLMPDAAPIPRVNLPLRHLD
jgi:hypothetical protein